MIVSIVPNEDTIFTALRTFLEAIVPVGTEVLQGQTNRVPETEADDFVVMVPIRRARLSTNVDSNGDVFFTGDIATPVDGVSVMTVTEVFYGVIEVENQVFGPTIANAPVVTEQLSGTVGGIGTYSIAPSLALVPSGPLAAGVTRMKQPTDFHIQIDVHGPKSGDTSQIISTYFRDDAGYEAMQALNPNLSPLYADDPKQIPFTNENQQVENRWIIDSHLQANITVVIAQQYADTLNIDLIEVEATYSP